MGPLFLFIALVLNASGNICMKLGANKLDIGSGMGFFTVASKVLTNYILIIGVILFALNIVFYVLALTKMNLSAAYPVMTTGGFLIITLFSYFYLREPFTTSQVIGILLMAAGIVLVAQNLR